VWGAGCIMLEMMTFAFLWERKGMLSVQVLSRRVTYDDIPGEHSHACKDVAIGMLEPEPQHRPSASAVVKKCRMLLERSPAGEAGREVVGGDMSLAGFGHLAQGIEAIWRAGSGAAQASASPSAAHRAGQDGADGRDAHEQGHVGKGSHDRGKVAEFRRKTPAQAGRRPQAEDCSPPAQHAAALAPRADKTRHSPAQDSASRRASPLNVKRALRKRNLERSMPHLAHATRALLPLAWRALRHLSLPHAMLP
jgi:hypothetical protein